MEETLVNVMVMIGGTLVIIGGMAWFVICVLERM